MRDVFRVDGERVKEHGYTHYTSSVIKIVHVKALLSRPAMFRRAEANPGRWGGLTIRIISLRRTKEMSTVESFQLTGPGTVQAPQQ